MPRLPFASWLPDPIPGPVRHADGRLGPPVPHNDLIADGTGTGPRGGSSAAYASTRSGRYPGCSVSHAEARRIESSLLLLLLMNL